MAERCGALRHVFQLRHKANREIIEFVGHWLAIKALNSRNQHYVRCVELQPFTTDFLNPTGVYEIKHSNDATLLLICKGIIDLTFVVATSSTRFDPIDFFVAEAVRDCIAILT